MISVRLKFLHDILAWQGFKKSHWALYKEASRTEIVLTKYKSNKSYFFQELKFLTKALSLIRFSRVVNVTDDFASVHSENQHCALLKLSERFPFIFNSFEFNKHGVTRLHLTPISFCALLIFILFNARDIRKLSKGTYHYHQLKIFMYGLICRDQIDFTSVGNVFVSNDHHPETRVLLYFREKYNFRLVYKQHAQVSDLFPPLEWDHAILDGRIAYEQYKNIGDLKSKVWIIGNDKTADLLVARGKFNRYKIGVAINSLDDIGQLSQYLKRISNIQTISRFLIRLHPALRKKSQEIGERLQYEANINFTFHYGDLVEYFSQISICISGASSILLEAAICKKLCVQHDFVPKSIGDYYGFLREKLAMPHETFLSLDTSLVDWDNLIEIQTTNAQLFSASLGRVTEGNELEKFLIEYRHLDEALNESF